MNSEIHKHSLRYLLFQRNVLLALIGIVSISLAIVSSFLFFKSERIVIVPPVVEKEFWIDSSNISVTYLEQFGYFLGELLLTKSAQSAPYQRTIILRHTDPRFSTYLQKKLVDEEQTLEKEHASYVFYPTGIYTEIRSKEVTLTGERTTYVSGKAVSTAKEGYTLSFAFQGSRLLLTGITEKAAVQ
jgi:conjugal transfer pilus assembly protein TraE